MIELDGVTVTLGHHPAWGIVDELCDTYDAAIELVTRPGHYTDAMDASVERKLGRLSNEDDLIRRHLARADNDGMVRFFRSETDPESNFDSILLAYDSVLAQIDTIRTARLQG